MNSLKDYLYYTRSERNSVLTFLALVMLLFTLPFLLSFLSHSQTQNFSEWNEDLIAFQLSLIRIQDSIAVDKKSAKINKEEKTDLLNELLNPFFFDPNTVSESELKKMGLPEFTVKSILNYREKGGKFRNEDDFGKMYGLSENHFNQLLPFVHLKIKTPSINTEFTAKPLPPPFNFDPNLADEDTLAALGLSPNMIKSIINYRNKGGHFRKKEDLKKMYNLPDSVYQHIQKHITIAENPQFKRKKYQPKTYYIIDVNLASSKDFQQFRGIGHSYAKRILKLKDALGGFVNKDQISELYNLPDSVFQHIKPFMICENPRIRKLNINDASLEELKDHPYLRWFQAKAIIKYRETEGPWKSVDLLQILPEFDDGKGTYDRVKSYLTID